MSVPRQARVEIDLLKGLVATAVMSHETRVPLYQRQREVLTELLDALWLMGEGGLAPMFAEDFRRAEGDAARRRVVADQVASLTDASALAWHERHCTG